jgi:hypothetical protein
VHHRFRVVRGPIDASDAAVWVTGVISGTGVVLAILFVAEAQDMTKLVYRQVLKPREPVGLRKDRNGNVNTVSFRIARWFHHGPTSEQRAPPSLRIRPLSNSYSDEPFPTGGRARLKSRKGHGAKGRPRELQVMNDFSFLRFEASVDPAHRDRLAG